jgi:hypothetical protein
MPTQVMLIVSILSNAPVWLSPRAFIYAPMPTSHQPDRVVAPKLPATPAFTSNLPISTRETRNLTSSESEPCDPAALTGLLQQASLTRQPTIVAESHFRHSRSQSGASPPQAHFEFKLGLCLLIPEFAPLCWVVLTRQTPAFTN